jgi:hypothetical protein
MKKAGVEGSSILHLAVASNNFELTLFILKNFDIDIH